MPRKKGSDQSNKPPATKRPVGRPPKMVVKIDDTPENVAKSMFGIPSDKRPPKRPDDTAKPTTSEIL